nr:MAG TPA: Large Terminase [Caudoviricetes sp.]
MANERPTRQTGQHHPAAVYAKQVVRGRLREQCGQYEILACQRFLDDLKRQDTEGFPYVFDVTRADRILRWFCHCIQVRGVDAGKPIALEPWQVFDLSNLYGWVHRDTGARRFKVSYSKRARGNYKSTEKSGQCLYHMCADAIYPPGHPEAARFEMEPEVECAAVDKPQAMRVFGDAKKIAQASPSIRRHLRIPRSNPVVHLTRGGFMRALSKETKNKDSGAPSYFVVDEYHAHLTSEIYDIGKSGFGKRPQALLDCITTAGDDAQRKPCYAEEMNLKAMLRREIPMDETYYVMIREIDETDNPHDESCWVKANPCLRYGSEYARYLLDEIRSEHTTAYSFNDPYKIRNFLTRRMDRWQAGAVNRYLDEMQLAKARESQVSREVFAAMTDGKACWGGFDLGKRVDLTGAAAVWLLEGGVVAVKMQGFMPAEGVERHEKTDRVPYKAWASGGYVTVTPGAVTENGWVDEWLTAGERAHGWRIAQTGYDGHNATDLAISMNDRRSNEDFCVEIYQSCSGQNLAVKGFRDLLMQGKLVIEESPLAMWCLANAVETVNGNGDSRLSKKHKDDTERIDPLAACMNALTLALRRRDNPTLADRLQSGTWSM